MESVNKIYIVTSGEYSDYGIEKVFLDETKARNYAKYHQAEAWGGMRVEEYEFADEGYELVTSGYWCVTTRIKACRNRGSSPFFTKFMPTTTTDMEARENGSKTLFLLQDDLTMIVTRYFPESTEEEEAKAKAEKIAYDILAEINSHIVEGEDAEEVIDLMRKKHEGD